MFQKHKYLGVFLLFLLLVVSACDPFGDKPDKRITISLELQLESNSQTEIDSAMAAIVGRLQILSESVEIRQIQNQARFRLSLETNATYERVRNLLLTPGKLEFFQVYKPEDLVFFITKADSIIATDDPNSEHPLLERIISAATPRMPEMLIVDAKDTAVINGYLAQNRVLNLLGDRKKETKFLQSKPMEGTGYIGLYALRTYSFGKAPLDGTFVTSTRMEYSQVGQPMINIQMDGEGAKIWEEMTGEAFKENYAIAIVVDDIVHSAPYVLNGAISGGASQISGSFTEEEASDLAQIIDAKAIPKVTILSYSVMPLK